MLAEAQQNLGTSVHFGAGVNVAADRHTGKSVAASSTKSQRCVNFSDYANAEDPRSPAITTKTESFNHKPRQIPLGMANGAADNSNAANFSALVPLHCCV